MKDANGAVLGPLITITPTGNYLAWLSDTDTVVLLNPRSGFVIGDHSGETISLPARHAQMYFETDDCTGQAYKPDGSGGTIAANTNYAIEDPSVSQFGWLTFRTGDLKTITSHSVWNHVIVRCDQGSVGMDAFEVFPVDVAPGFPGPLLIAEQ